MKHNNDEAHLLTGERDLANARVLALEGALREVVRVLLGEQNDEQSDLESGHLESRRRAALLSLQALREKWRALLTEKVAEKREARRDAK